MNKDLFLRSRGFDKNPGSNASSRLIGRAVVFQYTYESISDQAIGPPLGDPEFRSFTQLHVTRSWNKSQFTIYFGFKIRFSLILTQNVKYYYQFK